MFAPTRHTPVTCIYAEEVCREHDAVVGRLLASQALCLCQQSIVLPEHQWLQPVSMNGCDAREYFLSHEAGLGVYLRDPGLLYDVDCRADSRNDDNGW